MALRVSKHVFVTLATRLEPCVWGCVRVGMCVYVCVQSLPKRNKATQFVINEQQPLGCGDVVASFVVLNRGLGLIHSSTAVPFSCNSKVRVLTGTRANKNTHVHVHTHKQTHACKCTHRGAHTRNTHTHTHQLILRTLPLSHSPASHYPCRCTEMLLPPGICQLTAEREFTC
jgi:hypothetical protein